MALAAILVHPVADEFAFMEILVAVDATVVLNGRRHACLVAFLAIHELVLSYQLESGFIVVECFHAFVEVEGEFGVAFLAVLPELVFVDILVAGCAIRKSQPLEPLHHLAIDNFGFMAFQAIHLFVLPQKGEAGCAVVEPDRLLEGVESVAVVAFRRKFPLVEIGMAIQAFLAQTHERTGLVLELGIAYPF